MQADSRIDVAQKRLRRRTPSWRAVQTTENYSRAARWRQRRAAGDGLLQQTRPGATELRQRQNVDDEGRPDGDDDNEDSRRDPSVIVYTSHAASARQARWLSQTGSGSELGAGESVLSDYVRQPAVSSWPSGGSLVSGAPLRSLASTVHLSSLSMCRSTRPQRRRSSRPWRWRISDAATQRNLATALELLRLLLLLSRHWRLFRFEGYKFSVTRTRIVSF